MMKIKKNDFYAILLNETIYKPCFNPDFVTQTNRYNVGKKKELISLIYDKLRVSRLDYGKKFELVSQCPERVVHHVFERLYNDALKAKEKGLVTKFKSPLELHLGALDGGPCR
ncbi:MAG: hypothetical protein V1886_01685 [archaeon]